MSKLIKRLKDEAQDDPDTLYWQAAERIEVLEQAILKNVDISWEPWKSLFPQPGESQ